MGIANAAPARIQKDITGTTYMKGQAGFIEGTPHTWHFRYVRADLNVIACRPDINLTPGDASATVSLLSFTEHNFIARFVLRCGGGPGSLQYFVGTSTEVNVPLTNFPLNPAPAVGDELSLRIFYNHKGPYWNPDPYDIELTVIDKTTGSSAGPVRVRPAGSGDAVYTHPSVEVFIDPSKVTQTTSDVPLWQYSHVRVTSEPNSAQFARGTVLGPWGTTKTVATSDGTATGRVVIEPYLWKNTDTFTVHLRPAG